MSRRVQLGYGTRQALATAAAMSERILSDIEKARRESYGPATLARLEQSLQWPPGTATRILKGELPAGDWNGQVQDDSPASTLESLGAFLAPGSPLSSTARVRLAKALQQLLAAARDGFPDPPNASADPASHVTVRLATPDEWSTGRALDALLNPETPMEEEDRKAIHQLMTAALQLGQTAMMHWDAKYGPSEEETSARMEKARQLAAETGATMVWFDENDQMHAEGRLPGRPG